MWPAIPALPHGGPCSTIGMLELNFRVRNGIGWVLRIIVTDRHNRVLTPRKLGPKGALRRLSSPKRVQGMEGRRLVRLTREGWVHLSAH